MCELAVVVRWSLFRDGDVIKAKIGPALSVLLTLYLIVEHCHESWRTPCMNSNTNIMSCDLMPVLIEVKL
jgi:hypothetical protein